MRSPRGIEALGSPVFVFAVALFVLNDFLLKQIFHSWVTGKISDFAGLGAFTIFLCAFWPERRRAVALGVTAAFVFWKSPLSQGAIDGFNAVSPLPVGRAVDYTDLAALPVAWWVCAASPLRAWPARRWLLQALAGASVLAFTATSMATYPYDIRRAADFSDAAALDEAGLQRLVDEVAARHGLRCHDCSPLSDGRSYIEADARAYHIYLVARYDGPGKRLFYDMESRTTKSPPVSQPVDAFQADLEQALRARFPGVTAAPLVIPLSDKVTLSVASRKPSDPPGSPENQLDSERAFAVLAEVAAAQGLKRAGDSQLFYAGRLFGTSRYHHEITVRFHRLADPMLAVVIECVPPECSQRQRAIEDALKGRLQSEFGKERIAVQYAP